MFWASIVISLRTFIEHLKLVLNNAESLPLVRIVKPVFYLFSSKISAVMAISKERYSQKQFLYYFFSVRKVALCLNDQVKVGGN